MAKEQSVTRENLARAFAIARNVDPDEVIDVFGNKAWSWYQGEADAIMPLIQSAFRAGEVRGIERAAWVCWSRADEMAHAPEAEHADHRDFRNGQEHEARQCATAIRALADERG